MRLPMRTILTSSSASICMLALCVTFSRAQTALPQIDVTVASPIRRAPARPAPAQPAPAQPAPAAPARRRHRKHWSGQFQSSPTSLPPLRWCRTPSCVATAHRPSATSYLKSPASPDRVLRPAHPADRSFAVWTSIVCASRKTALAPMARPILAKITSCPSIRSRATKSRSFAAPRHCVSARRRSAASSRATNNRVPTYIPGRGISAEFRGAGTSVNSGIDGAALLDAGGANFAMHADAFGRTGQDYRIPSYPYLVPPNPADAPNATQPSNFNGHQPNSSDAEQRRVGRRFVHFQ